MAPGRSPTRCSRISHTHTNPAGSLSPSQWQARTDGHIEESDTGSTPLWLPVPTSPSGLQACLNQWSDNTFQRALCWSPEILPVVLCRWQDGSKSKVSISWQEPVQVGVWNEGQARTQDAYQAISGVAHRGEELSSGQYQAFWQERSTTAPSAQVCITDDYRHPWQASGPEKAALHQDLYMLLLKRLT